MIAILSQICMGRFNMIDKELLAILVCPLTGGRLVLSDDKTELLCKLSSLAYPIKDSVPVMLVAEARKLTQKEKDAL